MMNVLLVALGGAMGSVVRFALVMAVKPHSAGFPMGTLLCNLAGCLVIGLLAGMMGASVTGEDRAKLFLFTGVLGGFTTFSSFGLETVGLLREGRVGTAVAYVAVSNVVGLALVAGGWAVARGAG